ncbi:dNTP triphosphohydrolase [Paracoccus sp. MBLB3053]|uniref:DNTP triphosphohydrolase n=1 Tax=Paracoccus aurantius TaxID=3073814 RepID=A0ABU2HSP7_9RHOB|nr:dNTP triphosphohydrolase [Paracoccus sp. MBLB3053]MDS9467634.1 dNTP triphosphohydrolase [Paracoccus sp. MBLB3053]
MGNRFRMNWESLLSAERLGDKTYQPHRNRSIFVQDHDRIVFSAPFRRLANKTQVQPLYENDHVHHRLIHSIEVSSVGRSLAMRVGHWLAETGELPEPQVPDLADIVQAACVAHDIGNPPFGHSGEEAMGAWFSEGFANARGLLADLPAGLRPEFTAFEGNAQGFRILTRLEMYRGDGGMRLSKATLGAFTKYPVTAPDRECINGGSHHGETYVGLKKFGIFVSDLPQFATAARSLGLPERTHEQARYWARHPLVFLMEAADDITYNIVDLEDAYTTGELPFDLVRRLLAELGGKPNSNAPGMTEAEEIGYLRARGIGSAIEASVDAFITHYDAIMRGTFSGDLIGASRLGEAFAAAKAVARERIFTAPRKTELEISGRRIIANVMSGILPVYEDLARGGWDIAALSPHSRQLVRALSLDLRDIRDAESALHALADFTSGMTDRYALRISRMLSGA